MPLSLLPCCPDHFSIPSRAPATSGYAFAITVQYHPAVPGALQVRDLQIHGQHLPNRADRKHSSHNCLTSPSSFLDEKPYVEHTTVVDWHGQKFHQQRTLYSSTTTHVLLPDQVPLSSNATINQVHQPTPSLERWKLPVNHPYTPECHSK